MDASFLTKIKFINWFKKEKIERYVVLERKKGKKYKQKLKTIFFKIKTNKEYFFKVLYNRFLNNFFIIKFCIWNIYI